MSIRVMSAVWGMDLPDSEMLILLALADWCNDEGQCWPSIAQLVRKTRKSERTIQGTIKSLVAKGHMSREERLGKGCSYTLHPRSDCAPAEIAPRTDRAPAKVAPPQPLPLTPAAAADNTSIHTITSQKASPSSRTRASKPDEFPCPEGVDPIDWEALKANRRAKRAALSVGAHRQITRKLTDWDREGWPPGPIVAFAAERGWTTVFQTDEMKGQANGLRNGSPERLGGNGRGGAPVGRSTTVDAATRFLERRGIAVPH